MVTGFDPWTLGTGSNGYTNCATYLYTHTSFSIRMMMTFLQKLPCTILSNFA